MMIESTIDGHDFASFLAVISLLLRFCYSLPTIDMGVTRLWFGIIHSTIYYQG